MNTVEATAVSSTVRRMLAGNLAAINDLPSALRPVAQARYAAAAEAHRRDELDRQRANPVHVDPAGGLH